MTESSSIWLNDVTSLQGKVTIITGASFGLGKSIALNLAPKGVNLALVARTKPELLKVKEEVRRLGSSCEMYVCDVRDAGAVEQTMTNVRKDFGTIDILINNAGVYYEEPTADMTIERIDAQFETNAMGTVYMTKYVLPIFMKKNAGQILNVVSIAGVETDGEWGIYAATKHAIRGFTESLRKEVAKTKIKVMAVYPEIIDTHIFKAAGYDQYKPGESRMMKPDDVADIVIFMLKRPHDVVMGHVEIRKIES